MIFHMLRDNQPYRERGTAHFDEKRQPEITKRMVRRLEGLGYRVTLEMPLTPEEIREFSPPIAPLPQIPAARRRGRPCKCAERRVVCTHRHQAQTPNQQN